MGRTNAISGGGGFQDIQLCEVKQMISAPYSPERIFEIDDGSFITSGEEGSSIDIYKSINLVTFTRVGSVSVYSGDKVIGVFYSDCHSKYLVICGGNTSDYLKIYSTLDFTSYDKEYEGRYFRNPQMFGFESDILYITSTTGMQSINTKTWQSTYIVNTGVYYQAMFPVDKYKPIKSFIQFQNGSYVTFEKYEIATGQLTTETLEVSKFNFSNVKIQGSYSNATHSVGANMYTLGDCLVVKIEPKADWYKYYQCLALVDINNYEVLQIIEEQPSYLMDYTFASGVAGEVLRIDGKDIYTKRTTIGTGAYFAHAINGHPVILREEKPRGFGFDNTFKDSKVYSASIFTDKAICRGNYTILLK